MWKKTGKVVAILISAIALILWLEQVTRGVREEAVKSIPLDYLWWGLGIAAALGVLVWFLKDNERRRQTAGMYRSRWFLWPLVLSLLVLIGVGVHEHYGPFFQKEDGLSSAIADTTRTVLIRPDQPAVGVIPPGWRMDSWEDPIKVNLRVLWRGTNKIGVFSTKSGVEEAEVRFRIYPCSTQAPC